jgi:hypothetical protein
MEGERERGGEREVKKKGFSEINVTQKHERSTCRVTRLNEFSPIGRLFILGS